ncbi:MAG: four helix bundle protein [Parcubacteria group bacterium]|nr:four helix bundle protein [Parcubacteria group bacterium]MBI3075202.1 four helix bundle protein [Parcubacteria group bacterium]
MEKKGYKDLIVWQKSMELVVLIYGLTDSFPESERYGLTSQLRRCAISIPSNIAEGSKRGTKKDFHHFLLMSFGSGAELETQLEIAKRLSYIKNTKKHEETLLLLDEVMRMLSAMVNRSN